MCLLDPLQRPGITQTDAVGVGWNLVRERLRTGLRQCRALDHEAQFRVESCGARIEVERPYEHVRAVDRERLGMQARGGAAHDAVLSDRGPRRGALDLEQLDPILEEPTA